MRPAPYGVPSLLLVLPIALLIGWAATLYQARRSGHGWGRLATTLCVLSVTSLAGAKIYSLIEHGSAPTFGSEVVYGFRQPGGLIGLAVGIGALRLVWPSWASLAGLADDIAPAIALASAVVRVSCFLNGCCTGVVCSLPWCIGFPRFSPPWELHLRRGAITGAWDHSLPVHPLQLYFGVWSLILAIVLMRRAAHKSYRGQIFLLFLLLENGMKFALESLRDPREPSLQLLAALLAASAGVLLALGRHCAGTRQTSDDGPATRGASIGLDSSVG